MCNALYHIYSCMTINTQAPSSHGIVPNRRDAGTVYRCMVSVGLDVLKFLRITDACLSTRSFGDVTPNNSGCLK